MVYVYKIVTRCWPFVFVGYSDCSANTTTLPVASAVIVHACGASEAEYWIRHGAAGQGGGPASFDKAVITVGATNDDEVNPSATGTAASGESATVGFGKAEKTTQKTVEVDLSDLPTMAQCKAWGYVPQLGEGGCIPRKGSRCSFITTDKMPSETYKDRKDDIAKRKPAPDKEPKQ